jgi:Ca-activated chloride channel family protein
MKYAKIEMLFCIWAIPILFLVFVYGMKKRQKILSRFASKKGLEAIVPGADSKRRWIKAGLILFVLFFLAISLSGPKYGYKWQEIERKGIDIIIALDCSRSMLAEDIHPTRLDRAKREVYDLLTMLQGDRVGLVAFAGTAFLQCPLTLDYDAFHLFLNALSPDFLPMGGTDIAGAVLTSVFGFDEKANAEKAVILITDGENTGEDDPLKAAEDAAKAGVKLFCIGVGKDQGVPVPDKKGGFKKDISGKIIRSVAGDMDLEAIYTREIRGKMKSSTLSSGRKQIWEDRYQWFLALAIIALVVELFLPFTKKTPFFLAFLFIFLLSLPAEAGSMKDGLYAYEKGDYEKALKFFIDAQLEDPEEPEILYNIGNAYYKIGDFESAINNYKQALKSENKRLRQKAFYNLGNSNYRKQGFEDAIKNYQAAIKIDPNDEQAKQNLEFVKKVMEHKKEEQKHRGKNNEQSDTKKNDPEKQLENMDDGKSGNDTADEDNSQKQSSSPDYVDEMDAHQDLLQKTGSMDKQNLKDEKKTGPAQSASSAGPDEKKKAERMLNRLNDRPGRAMIPLYRKKHVEKDW